jgi:hypothetical protein
MGDMLVKLWTLPPLEPALAACASDGVTVRRALAPEKPLVLAWIGRHFAAWAAEADVAFARQPVACFVALRQGRWSASRATTRSRRISSARPAWPRRRAAAGSAARSRSPRCTR